MHWKPLSILSLLLLTGFATCGTCGQQCGQVKEKEYEEKPLKSSCECGIQRGPKKREVPRVINGDIVEPRNKYPWMIKLYYSITKNNTIANSFTCGASILSSRYVLTAAHCLINERNYSSELPGNCFKSSNGYIFCPHPLHIWKLRYYNPADDTEIDLSLSSYKFDARYDLSGFYDIALIRTAEELPCNEFTAPICLPRIGDELYQNNSTATLAGWGVFKQGPKHTHPSSEVLREGNLKISEDEEVCKNKRPNNNIDDMICAWDKSKNSCSGDSGGPIFKEHKGRHYAIGISSYGDSHCYVGDTSYFTKVRAFLPWIKKHMDPKSKLGPNDREVKE